MDVEKIAELARINLTREEKDVFQKELDEVLKAFGNLKKIGVRNVSPSFHAIPIVNDFRKDKAGKSLTQKQALKNAEKEEKGYFKSPKTI